MCCSGFAGEGRAVEKGMEGIDIRKFGRREGKGISE